MLSVSALAIMVGSWIFVPGGDWQPSENEIADAKAKLRPYAIAQAKHRNDKLPPWERYTFQYQGLVQDGRKVIYVNAFCSEPPDFSAEQMVVVFDGGVCFFQAYYDTATKSFIRLTFNGVS